MERNEIGQNSMKYYKIVRTYFVWTNLYEQRFIYKLLSHKTCDILNSDELNFPNLM